MIISIQYILRRIIRLIFRCLIFSIPNEKIFIDYLTRKCFRSLYKHYQHHRRIRIHDTQTIIIPRYRIDLRNHLKIQNHATLIDTDSIMFTQTDGMKLGPITKLKVNQ